MDAKAPAKRLNKVDSTKLSEMLSEKLSRLGTLLSVVERC